MREESKVMEVDEQYAVKALQDLLGYVETGIGIRTLEAWRTVVRYAVDLIQRPSAMKDIVSELKELREKCAQLEADKQALALDLDRASTALWSMADPAGTGVPTVDLNSLRILQRDLNAAQDRIRVLERSNSEARAQVVTLADSLAVAQEKLQVQVNRQSAEEATLRLELKELQETVGPLTKENQGLKRTFQAVTRALSKEGKR